MATISKLDTLQQDATQKAAKASALEDVAGVGGDERYLAQICNVALRNYALLCVETAPDLVMHWLSAFFSVGESKQCGPQQGRCCSLSGGPALGYTPTSCSW